MSDKMPYINPVCISAKRGSKKYSYHRLYFWKNSKREIIDFECKNDNTKGCTHKQRTDQKYCSGLSTAVKKKNAMTEAIKAQTQAIHGLTKAEQVEILQMLKLADDRGISLSDCIRITERAKGPEKRILVTDAFQVWLDNLLRLGKSDDHIKDVKTAKRKIEDQYLRTFVDQLVTADLEVWVQGLRCESGQRQGKPLAPKTYDNLVNMYASWWNWLDKKKTYSLQEENPFAAIDRIYEDDGERDCLTCEEVTKVLDAACESPRLALVVVLQLFCGIRAEEAMRLRRGDIWLNLDEPKITVRAWRAKKREKRVNEFWMDHEELYQPHYLTPNAYAWVKYVMEKTYEAYPKYRGNQFRKDLGKKFKTKDGRVLPPVQKIKTVGPDFPINPSTYRNYKCGRRSWQSQDGQSNVTGIEGLLTVLNGRPNVLRHTFITMHVKAFGSCESTSELAGNSFRSIKNSYLKSDMPKREAQMFWKLLP